MATIPGMLSAEGTLLATRAPGVAEGELGRRQAEFSRVLSAERSKAAGEDEAERVARDLVSVALVGPLLKQWREMEQSPPPFGPGAAEKQFRAMQDSQLAQELTRAQRFPLVDRLARDLRRAAGAGVTA
ncbi:MAG: rod-binding protein [Phycisphaerae bacterium]|nr:rod-binding protein [Phycisphaerae bacterium]